MCQCSQLPAGSKATIFDGSNTERQNHRGNEGYLVPVGPNRVHGFLASIGCPHFPTASLPKAQGRVADSMIPAAQVQAMATIKTAPVKAN